MVPGVEHNNALFLTRRGTPFTERGVDYLFKSYARKFGLYHERLSLHVLRRSCLTFLYKQGVDLFVLKEISGHARVQTLEHYINVDKSKVATAMTQHPLANRGLDPRLVEMIRGGDT